MADNPIIPETADRLLESARRAYANDWRISTGPLSWRVRDTGGEKRPLVLLPGSLGTADIFSHQIAALSTEARCLAIDYPHAAPEALADGLATLLHRLDALNAIVLGSSLAGYWLQFFGARHPDVPARIILASTFRDAGGLTGHPLFDVAALSRIDGRTLKCKWLSMLHQQSPTVLRELQLRLLEHGQDGELLRLRLMAAASATVAPRMALLPENIAIIACEDDPLLGTATRNRLLGSYPDARRLVLSTGGHYPHVTRHAEFNAFVRKLMV